MGPRARNELMESFSKAVPHQELNTAKDIGVGSFVPLCFRDRKDSLNNFMFSYLEEQLDKKPSNDVLDG